MSRENKRGYTHIKAVEQQVLEMLAIGKTQREVSEYFGFKNKRIVKSFVYRNNRTRRRLEVGIVPCKRGRPSKGSVLSKNQKDFEIQRLRMENQLLRSFLQLAGRR